jgi:hypothetical protein
MPHQKRNIDILLWIGLFIITSAIIKKLFVLYQAIQEHDKAKTLNTSIILTLFLCVLIILIKGLKQKSKINS